MTDENKQIIEVKQDEVKPIEKTEVETLKEKLALIEKEKQEFLKEKEELRKQKELENLPENEKKRQKEIDEKAEQKANEILKNKFISRLEKNKDFLEFSNLDSDDLKEMSLKTLEKLEEKFMNKKIKDVKEVVKIKDTPGPIGNNGSGAKKKITDEDFIKEYSKK